MVATYLIARTQNDMSPSIYLMVAACVSIAQFFRLAKPPERRWLNWPLHVPVAFLRRLVSQCFARAAFE